MNFYSKNSQNVFVLPQKLQQIAIKENQWMHFKDLIVFWVFNMFLSHLMTEDFSS